MNVELYFIKICQPFVSGIVQRQSTSSSALLTHNLSRAKFFETKQEAEKFTEKIKEKCYSLNNHVKFEILTGCMEVKHEV